ncbi:MAG: hypothetical protein EWV41_01380 [Microcystis wesenbergii Mw_MB_S_20031200_S109]|uniref:Uncharacterized protein n=1 Tax=Microcystis wesenbergii Mw_MB_S_20031200_S109D TaxID=2486241 RepID=A0A552LU46_9CHRO|nr:MAG: hypothetical protein EWV41_01380 [Microcystis wesenbergii Mw_MB_S_20031200_S109]TRV23740.1 MAG: hypothetical protein EWV88_10755 [Microcystis wesenbergii Mw_MB_S_20031200_S109D]
MLKNDWIKLINAIRLRKLSYSGEDGELSYYCWYQKVSQTRSYIDDNDGVNYKHEEYHFSMSEKNPNGIQQRFGLTFIYGHEIHPRRPKLASYPLDKIIKSDSQEVFIPHIPISRYGGGAFEDKPNSYSQDFLYKSGLYAAAFLYAFDVQEPRLQLIDQEWIVIDKQMGYSDFAVYFMIERVIPVKLPIPKFIEPQKMPVLKLAEGVEITDTWGLSPSSSDDYAEVARSLNEIRKEISSQNNTD